MVHGIAPRAFTLQHCWHYAGPADLCVHKVVCEWWRWVPRNTQPPPVSGGLASPTRDPNLSQTCNCTAPPTTTSSGAQAGQPRVQGPQGQWLQGYRVPAHRGRGCVHGPQGRPRGQSQNNPARHNARQIKRTPPLTAGHTHQGCGGVEWRVAGCWCVAEMCQQQSMRIVA